ncbi:N-terminal C2 in EEIG1 and EHBP1 proteins-domain-containing protein [Roridomyces roridus]|uniref:N-terminal C2 in EEIG1 and EHBP1 proteins-domain-containing protein n=1 Tax=Roridomyces roridus TaxID=1738132 RepID=A0AAD7FSE4_9AGAR|nr:N-terminal C2 in EEIG1 and EHBP1 proteins-domain-containing protein [Roridomyces roridus]
MSAHTSELDDAPSGGKLRAHLAHLLPRHARFNVRITIHQLASVPLLGGEFGCRWRFKNTTHMKARDSRDSWDHDSGDSYSMASSDDPRVYAIPPRRKGSSDSSLSMDDDYPEGSTSTRGRTPWLPLRDHSVTWEHPLSTVVQMSIERHTHKLLPHPFKLTVLQRVIAHDPNAPANPRLGTIELDLAEFVDSVPNHQQGKGTVTRRYLLCDSKTNATLRLSVHVEPTPSRHPFPHFTAPPLPLDDIFSGSSSTLVDIHRTRPRALDVYSHSPVDPGVFDLRALPRAYGPDATASLIDALFNPTPVHDPRLLNPFTKLVTAEEDETTSLRSSSLGSRASVDLPGLRTLVPNADSPTPLSPDDSNASSLSSARTRWWSLKPTRGRSQTAPGARVVVA